MFSIDVRYETLDGEVAKCSLSAETPKALITGFPSWLEVLAQEARRGPLTALRLEAKW